MSSRSLDVSQTSILSENYAVPSFVAGEQIYHKM